ncbi:MAG: hypothetical protein Q9175_007753 [Cornicularia normoerica]
MADQSGSHEIEHPEIALFRHRATAIFEEGLRASRQAQPNPASAKEILDSLPTVKPDDLPENSQVCHICKELFDDPGAEENTELAVKLPCNHIMGSECLARWFEGHDSCPMCRVRLARPVFPLAHALRALIADIVAWSPGARRLANEERSEVGMLAEVGAELALRRPLASEEQPEALSAVDADLSSLSAENDELVARVRELRAAPETEEGLREISRIGRRLMGIDVRLVEIGDWMRRMESRGEAAS